MRAESIACALTFALAATVGSRGAIAQELTSNANSARERSELEEIVVTGVFLGTRKQDASIAISTIDADQIDKIVPLNSVDLLRDVPGFFVDTSYGEIRSVVIARGIAGSAGSAATGYYYVSMQEDGLPILNVNGPNFGPDYFIRPDITLQRVEALRGGTASVTGPNAPGGIFNYLSKTGKSSPGSEVSARFGLEGDGRNPFYRTDLFHGGTLGEDTYFSVGGFYRRSDGARAPDGYPSNDGGQIKANVLRDYESASGSSGTLMLYGKYLNDHNNYTEFFPTQGFNHPRLAAGVRNTDEYSLPAVQFDYPAPGAAGSKRFDSEDVVHSTSKVVGLRWEHDSAAGWKFSNNLKHSDSEAIWNSSAIVFPAGLDSFLPYALIGQLFAAGTYDFVNVRTGEHLAQVQTDTGLFDFTVTENSLPGQQIQANGVYLQPAYAQDYRSRELIDQFTVSKRMLDDSFLLNFGGYYAHTNFSYDQVGAGFGLGTLQHHPDMLGITLTTPTGEVRQITNPQGFAALGGSLALSTSRDKLDDYAAFMGANWKMSDHFILDIGARYGYLEVDAANMSGETNPGAADPAFGGVDGNPLTEYDNEYFEARTPLTYSRSLHTFSHTAALTYRMNERNSTYLRYAFGEKAPDLFLFAALSTPTQIAGTRIAAQKILSLEVGYAYTGDRIDFSLTPFLTKLRDIPQQVQLLDPTTGQLYLTPTLYNSTRTYGVELEGNARLGDVFDVHVSLTAQDAEADSWRLWAAGGAGPGSDTIQDFSGGPADNIPDLMSSVTFNYTPAKAFSTFLTWRYLGDRPSSVVNTWTMPGFHTIDIGATFNVTSSLTVNANINNVTDEFGVLSWFPPDAFALGLSRDAFTPELRAANPNAIYSTTANQPRAYFLTMSYRF